MKRLRDSQPNPALAVAVLALVAAVAGTAVAADPVATTAALNRAEKTKVKNIARAQAKQQINKLAPGLSVAFAQRPEAPTRPPAPR
jgi:hypothetical protein